MHSPLTEPKVSSVTVGVDDLDWWEDQWLDLHRDHADPDGGEENGDESWVRFGPLPDYDPDEDEEGPVHLLLYCGTQRPRGKAVSVVFRPSELSGKEFVTLHDYLSTVHPWLMSLREDILGAMTSTASAFRPDQPLSSQPQLQIFNPHLSIRYKEVYFHLFPQLPIEIRLRIWQLALKRERIIKVEITSPDRTKTGVGKSSTITSSSGRFCLFVEGYQTVPKFFRVTRESRAAASKLYRIHLPCRLTTGPEGRQDIDHHHTKAGTLFFNPEYDFLHIIVNDPVNEYLEDYLHNLKYTYDPLHVGLLNLITEADQLRKFQLFGFSFNRESAFLEPLRQLRNVFFSVTVTLGRTNFGYHTGLTTGEFFFNRSLPIMPLTPSFQRLTVDPRPIAADLTKLFLSNIDPQSGCLLWRDLLTQLGVSPARAEYRHLIAFITHGGESAIYDRASASRWLEKEDYQWRHPEIGTFKFADEDLERAVKPAFGFWLFPLSAFEPVQEDDEAEESQASTRDLGTATVRPNYFDMTGCDRPELALSSLF